MKKRQKLLTFKTPKTNAKDRTTPRDRAVRRVITVIEETLKPPRNRGRR